MEVLINTLADQLKIIASSGATKYINTGEKAIDTALQIITSAFAGSIITLLIHLFVKGGWKKVKRWLIKDKNNSNINFEVEDIKDINMDTLKFRSQFRYTHTFQKWFDVVHVKTNIPLEKKSYIYINEDSNTDIITVAHGVSQSKANTCIPCWKGNDGYIVFYNPSTYTLYSDSQAAIRECLEDIKRVLNEKKLKESIKNNVSLLYDITISDKGAELISLGSYDKRSTFNTIFFEQKAMLMKVIDNFKNKSLYPAHLPIENKLGILLHGPPGTGKTRLIAAIANYLEYSIVMVDMSKIKTKKQFATLLKDTIDKNIILVLEEFDCVKGILSRELKKEPENELSSNAINPYMMLLANEKEKSKEITDMIKKENDIREDGLDLGYILSKLDGLESNEGRIIIATTNHPDRIDPALLRPGRLGLKICLSYATQLMIRDILCMVYNI